MAIRCDEHAFPDGTGRCALPKGHAGRHLVSGMKPDIAELEQILAQDGEQEVEIAPNGELLSKPIIGCCPKHDVRWSGLVGCPTCQEEREVLQARVATLEKGARELLWPLLRIATEPQGTVKWSEESDQIAHLSALLQVLRHAAQRVIDNDAHFAAHPREDDGEWDDCIRSLRQAIFP